MKRHKKKKTTDILHALINGDPWHIYVLEDEDFKKSAGCSTLAYTCVDNNSIFFTAESISSPRVIAHELTHAYWSYCCIDGASLKPHQTEEVLCDFVPMSAGKVLSLTEWVFRWGSRLSIVKKYHRGFKSK